MIAGKDIKEENRETFESKCKLGNGGMNNAKEKKANNGFGEGKGDALYLMGVFIPILNMKKGAAQKNKNDRQYWDNMAYRMGSNK